MTELMPVVCWAMPIRNAQIRTRLYLRVNSWPHVMPELFARCLSELVLESGRKQQHMAEQTHGTSVPKKLIQYRLS